jgi:peptide chain release factor subunit 1
MPDVDTVLILTPVKNASSYLTDYFRLLARLDYPTDRLAIGMLEGDSSDNTFADCERWLRESSGRFRRADLFKHEFGFRIAPGTSRHEASIQLQRRSVLAKARNHLLFSALEPDDQWVLWLDVDLADYAPDTLRRLLAAGKDIVHPDCVVHPATVADAGGLGSFDLNAWSDNGQRHLHDFRGGTELVPLDAVGGTMLLVRADRHRDGLVFPCYPYGVQSLRVRPRGMNDWYGEIETEGFGIMATDMGTQCWGVPNLRVVHR